MKKKLIVLAMLLAFTSGCAAKQTAEIPELLEPVGVNMDTFTVTAGDYINTDSYPGSIVPDTTDVCFSVDGVVEEVFAYPGEWVEKGDKLIALDLEDLTEQIEDLTAQIADIETEAVFDDQLADIGIQTLQVEHQQIVNAAGYWSDGATMKRLEIEQATTAKTQMVEAREQNLANLKSKQEKLNANVTDQVITAPHAGHVFFKDTVKAGAAVRAGKPICYVTDPSRLTFITETFVSDSSLKSKEYYGWIGGKARELTPLPFSSEELIEATTSGKSFGRSFSVAGNAAELKELYAGQSGVLMIETTHETGVLTVPSSAVKRNSDGYYLYVVEGDTRTKRNVEIGSHNDVETVITYGLSEGEVIYVQN